MSATSLTSIGLLDTVSLDIEVPKDESKHKIKRFIDITGSVISACLCLGVVGLFIHRLVHPMLFWGVHVDRLPWVIPDLYLLHTIRR